MTLANEDPMISSGTHPDLLKMTFFPNLSKRNNLTANRVLYAIRNENALCIAQIIKLCDLERKYATNIVNILKNEGIIERIFVPSPFPENFSYFYDLKTPLFQVETKIKSDLKSWRSVFPKWSTEVHDSLLRHIAHLFRKFGFRGINSKGISRIGSGIKDKTLLSKIGQGRADFDIVLASKFNNQHLIIEIKNRNSVPASEAEVVRFGERIKYFPDYKPVFISRDFTGTALEKCREYNIQAVEIGVQVLTPYLFRTLLNLPHYGSLKNINGNSKVLNCDTWSGGMSIQWKLEDFLNELPKEPSSIEGFIKRFNGDWRKHYSEYVKFQARLDSEIWSS